MLERLDEGLWVASAPQTFMGIHVGTRMTVVRLSAGELWLHSPIAINAASSIAIAPPPAAASTRCSRWTSTDSSSRTAR